MSGLEPRPSTTIQSPARTPLRPGPRRARLPQDGPGAFWSLRLAASPSAPTTARVHSCHSSGGDTPTPAPGQVSSQLWASAYPRGNKHLTKVAPENALSSDS